MLQGLYKVEFETPRRKASGVVFVDQGKLHGGSSAFAYIGSVEQTGQSIAGVVAVRRHTHDPNLPSVFGIDDVRIQFHGSSIGDFAQIEGTAVETPAMPFKAVLTRLNV